VQHKRKVAVQPFHQSLTPLRVAVEQDLGVGPCSELVSLPRQLRRQLDVVEDLAVERDDESPIGRRHRLRAALEVDDAETDVGHPHATAERESESVRAAMRDRRRHAAQRLGVDPSGVAPRDTGEAAHQARPRGASAPPAASASTRSAGVCR
jgi:hypothetical protein